MNCGDCPLVGLSFSFGGESKFGFFCMITRETIFEIPCDEARMMKCPDISGKTLYDISPPILMGDEKWDENPLWPERIAFWKQRVLSQQECFQTLQSVANEMHASSGYVSRLLEEYRKAREDLKHAMQHRRDVASIKRRLRATQ